MMKLYSSGIFLLISFLISSLHAEPISLQITAQEHARLKIFIGVCSDVPELQTAVDYIKKALEFTGQFEVQNKTLSKMPSRQELMAFWQQGYPYALLIESELPQALAWRLYDTSAAAQIKGKRHHINHEPIRAGAYAIADTCWQELTGTPGFFSCKLAYCKEIWSGNRRHYKHIYIADYDGSHEQLLVNTPTINMAPRWNGDATHPLLFYSESTNANVRMMASRMDKKRVMASNFDGLNMLPAFSADGGTVVYCVSRGQGNCQLYQWRNKELKRLTHNEGNNICPCMHSDGKTLFFASDFQSGMPQIYAYHFDTQAIDRLTQDGYCVSPAYCDATNTLAYSKMVRGTMQLFEYDLKTQQHRQLTFDKANKEECAWAPGGVYLLCPVVEGRKSRIAFYNTVTKQYTYLTNSKDQCSFPAISRAYSMFPIVQG